MYNFRSIIKSAWALVRQIGISLSEAMTAAWASAKLAAQMKKGACSFSFTKADGTIRKAVGTLCDTLISYEYKGGSNKCATTQSFWDLEAGGWKSYKINSLMSA
ncbi:MAG: SH3 beta-barrel fold-containing protein [Shewanella sp.]